MIQYQIHSHTFLILSMQYCSIDTKRLTIPVTMPPKGVQTPLAALTADRPMEVVTAIDPTKDPNS